MVVSWELSEHRVLVKAVQFGDTGNTQPSPLGQHSRLWNEMAPVCEEKEWHCLAFPASLSSTQFLLHFKCVFSPPILSLPTALLSLPLFCLALCEPLSCVPAEFLCPDTTDAEGQDWNYSRCNLHSAQGSLITSMIKYN